MNDSMAFNWQFGEYETRYYKFLKGILSGRLAGIEAFIGGNGLVDVILARQIWEAQPAICWVSNLPATGYMLPGDILVTNHHVLKSATEATGVEVRFNYQSNSENILETFSTFTLNPDDLFWTSNTLDLTLVAISGNPSFNFPCLRISKKSPRVGAPAIIIQHPGGGLKKFCLGDSEVTGIVPGGFFQYLTDTLPGSSGSPVFDDRMRLVGTHHRSILTPDGRGYFRNQGISWLEAIKTLPTEIATRIQVS